MIPKAKAKRCKSKGCSLPIPEGSAPWVRWCCPDHGTAIAMAKLERDKAKAERHRRKTHLEAKARLKTRSEWLKEAQIAFNSYIRERDKNLPCVSCQRPVLLKANASHYRSVGACPQLRFEPLNCWKACEHCNSYLSGNLINYRIELLNRIGEQKLAWIEGNHPVNKYTIDQIRAIKADYKQKLRDLK